MWGVGGGGQRKGLDRLAAPPLHPAFPEPQPDRTPWASLSEEVLVNSVFGPLFST